jgi:hypothetical protein
MKIITADERLAQKSMIKGLIIGPFDIGKTSLLFTLDAETTLFANAEAGELSVREWSGDMVRIRTWPEARALACAVGGPNPALDEDRPYSQGHYDAIIEDNDVSKYKTIFGDSLTEFSRICFSWCQTQPEAFSDKTGKPNMLGAYGLLGREMIAFLKQFQHCQTHNVWLVGLLDEISDEFGRKSWTMQVEGTKTKNEAPGILDTVLCMVQMKPDDGEPYRAFVTSSVNQWGYPAKDRSGRLNLIEEPHLGRLMEKINSTNEPIAERLSYGNINETEEGQE